MSAVQVAGYGEGRGVERVVPGHSYQPRPCHFGYLDAALPSAATWTAP